MLWQLRHFLTDWFEIRAFFPLLFYAIWDR